MSRKDYVAVAAAMKANQPAPHWCANKHVQYGQDVNALANVFAAGNPRFDRARFLAACGIN